jgi:hypothetical protein
VVRVSSLFLIAVTACTSPTPTSEIGATFDATVQDGKLVLALQLADFSAPDNNGPPPYVLMAGEGVRATFRETTVALVQGDDYGYYADVVPAGEIAGDEPITVTFDRGGNDRVTFEVTSPPDFVPAAPASTPQPVDVTWSPTGTDPMRWTATTWCGQNRLDTDGPIPHDAGSIEFPIGVLTAPQPTYPCNATIEFARWRGSWPENALHLCTASFSRIRDVAVGITP